MIQVFELFDIDGSGKISRIEFIRSIKKLHRDESMKSCDVIFNYYNKDNELDYETFVKVAKFLEKYHGKSELDTIFYLADTNENGLINSKEALEVAKAFEPEIASKLKKRFAQIEGEINLSQFKNVIRGGPKK